MLRCSPKAYAKCPTRYLCGPLEDATFTEDSACAEFNRAVEDKPITNADRIRAMSDEELAEWIHDSCTCGCCSDDHECRGPIERDKCLKGVLMWLQQPAEEETPNHE